jgi:hypothetical protein
MQFTTIEDRAAELIKQARLLSVGDPICFAAQLEAMRYQLYKAERQGVRPDTPIPSRKIRPI